MNHDELAFFREESARYWYEFACQRYEVQRDVVERCTPAAEYVKYHPDFAYLDERELIRALRMGVGVDLLMSRVEVIERDGSTCAKCKQEIDLSLQYPDKGSVVFEHRKSLRRGGSHVLRNMCALHYRCSVVRASYKGRQALDRAKAYVPLTENLR